MFDWILDMAAHSNKQQNVSVYGTKGQGLSVDIEGTYGGCL